MSITPAVVSTSRRPPAPSTGAAAPAGGASAAAAAAIAPFAVPAPVSAVPSVIVPAGSRRAIPGSAVAPIIVAAGRRAVPASVVAVAGEVAPRVATAPRIIVWVATTRTVLRAAGTRAVPRVTATAHTRSIERPVAVIITPHTWTAAVVVGSVALALTPQAVARETRAVSVASAAAAAAAAAAIF